MFGHLTFKYGYPGISLGVMAASAALSSYRWLPQPIYVNSSFDFSIYWGVLFDFFWSICWFVEFNILSLLHSQDRLQRWFLLEWPHQWRYCSGWEASEAISFISACLWVASATLGCIYSLRLDSAVARHIVLTENEGPKLV